MAEAAPSAVAGGYLTRPARGPCGLLLNPPPCASWAQAAWCSVTMSGGGAASQQHTDILHPDTAFSLRPELASSLVRSRRAASFQQQHPHPPHLGQLLPQHVRMAFLQQLLPLLTAAHHQGERMLRGIRQHHPFHHLRRRSKEHTEGSSQQHQGGWFGNRQGRTAQRLHEQALMHERQLDPLAAAQAFEAAVAAEPQRVDWMILAGKQWSDACYQSPCTPEQAKERNRKGVEWSSKAIELAPTAAQGYVVRCVSRGRLALLMDNRTKVEMAREACDDAATALQLDPQYDYAHHLMGRWHYEMAGLNPFTRTLVRLMFGTSLMQGSYTQALHHFRTATQLAPHMLVHRVELGRTLIKLGQTEEAASELQEALQGEVLDLNAHLQKLDAELLLSQLPRSNRPALPAPAVAPLAHVGSRPQQP